MINPPVSPNETRRKIGIDKGGVKDKEIIYMKKIPDLLWKPRRRERKRKSLVRKISQSA